MTDTAGTGGVSVVNGTVYAPIELVWQIFRPFDFKYDFKVCELINGSKDVVGAIRRIQTADGRPIIEEKLIERDDTKYREKYDFVKSDPFVGLHSATTTVQMARATGIPGITTINWSSSWSADALVAPEIEKTQEAAYKRMIAFLNATIRNGSIQKIIKPGMELIQGAVAHLVACLNASDVGEYKYNRYPGEFSDLPRMVEGLPVSKALSPVKMGQLQQRLMEYFYSNTDFFGRLQQYQSKSWLEVFSNVYFNKWVKPSVNVVRDWGKDEEFCRQLLQGLNPMIIAKATTTTPITKELRELKSNGKTVDDLIHEGRLFILDYELLDGLPLYLNMYFYAPIVLLENTNTGLKILGIQLTRNKDAKNEVITPETAKTHPNRYLFAKMHVQCADIQVHQFVYHLGFTHLAMEPFAVAQHNVWATRYPAHKLGKLMTPHFKDNIGINYLARQTLITPNPQTAFTDRTFSLGTTNALRMFVKAWKKWDFHRYSFPGDLKARGFTEDGSDNLKNFYFRDDGFRIWNAIKEYVTLVVEDLYKDDKDVVADPAIKAWQDELRDPARADIKSFPELKTRGVLIESITTIIFNCSAQHSAINYSQLPYIAFIPNRPDLLYRPMPQKESTDITDDYIASALPDIMVSQFQVAFSYLLTTPPEQSDLMSELTATRDEFPEAHTQLMTRMKLISLEIERRNKELVKNGKEPYRWLQPDMINMSIAV